METEIVFVADDFERIEGHARQLIKSTLASLESEIKIIAVKVDYDVSLPLAIFDYHCTILMKIEGGATIRTEGRDCDEMLSIYRALAKIIEQTPMMDLEAGCEIS